MKYAPATAHWIANTKADAFGNGIAAAVHYAILFGMHAALGDKDQHCMQGLSIQHRQLKSADIVIALQEDSVIRFVKYK